MDSSWIKSPSGRRVLEHWADARPSWLWSQDGRTLLWRNTAARFFQAKPRKGDSAPSGEITPIRGQVARLIRLGSPNRASLSRMQFLAGERAVSATCGCTPINLPDDQLALLVVRVDPIEAMQLASPEARDPLLEALLPPGSDYLLVDDDGSAGGSPTAIERYAPIIADQGMPALDTEGNGRLDAEGKSAPFIALKASPQGASLLLFEAAAESVAQPAAVATPQAEPVSEPLLPLGLPPLPEAPAVGSHDAGEATFAVAPMGGGLASLFDRLMDDSALFGPLSADEDFAPPPSTAEPTPLNQTAPQETNEEGRSETTAHPPPQAIAPSATPSGTGQPSEATGEAPPDDAAAFLVTARQFTPLEASDASVEGEAGDGSADTVPAGDSEVRRLVEGSTDVEATAGETIEGAAATGDDGQPTADAELNGDVEAHVEATDGDGHPAAEKITAESSSTPAEITEDAQSPTSPTNGAPDAENVERVSRYNFDELSRILNDRVGSGDSDPARAVTPMPRFGTPAVPSAAPSGALVTLGGETLVLNRLPLGILVFREQQMLFANRAITEMTGYESVEALRAAGLGAIFSAGDEQHDAGPVNHLVQRDGTLVPVTARLQSVSWQGKPALMLSASATEVRTGHEAAVKAFAEHLASARADGFFETSRAGIIAYVSGDARLILKRQEEQLLGRPVTNLLAPGEIPSLREFFERPARFAETARPAITLKEVDRGIEIMLFAQGQAGIISGYFGFVRQTEGTALPAIAAPQGDADPALLTRLSRGVRRPLNTVIGFSDLIGSAAFGEIENERYLEYARDIKTAGLEIAALVDELDDFARLRDGRYAVRPSEIDLAVLLDSTVMRVRGQANSARVLVRSAISERLPRVRADRASLSQAILNLLASAIDQTPQDGSVVLSAQLDDAGGVTINVRDSANMVADLGERFVVFRDGIGRDGQALTPIRSSVGLALTRALLEVNQANLNVDPAGGAGTMFSLTIPAESVVEPLQLPAGPAPDATL